MFISFLSILALNFAWWLLCLLPPKFIHLKVVPKQFGGITLMPFIFYSKKEYYTDQFIKHELKHAEQYAQFSPLVFLIIYCGNFVINLFKYRNWQDAYWYIKFEIEAREAESL